MLGPTYRFLVKNATGQTLASGAVTIKAIREKFASDGSLTLEGTEATVFSLGSTLATGAFAVGTTQDNTTNKYLGGTFTYTITAPASAAGDVTIWLQHSTNGGTNFPDNGKGIQVASETFTTSGTVNGEFRL
jgi:hypothetical protein